jgi:2,3-bisphosphoglycerate-dependent phosphoglycerate mutase
MTRRIAALLRHGDYRQLPGAPSAHQPFPLTEAGEQQASEAAALLADDIQEHGWQLQAVIDSSCLLRGWQTAMLVSEQLRRLSDTACEVRSFPALAERCVGSAANLTIAEIEAIVEADPRYPPLPENWKSDSHFCLPLQGAESLMQAGERVAVHLRERMALHAEAAHDCIKLFVGHGAAFRHAACVLGAMPFEDIARLSMYHARPVYLEVSDSGDWRHIGGEWMIRDNRDDSID